SHVAPADTFVHLVGVSHPSPSKAPLFRSVDLKSLETAVRAAQSAQVKHFVYISVAHPAPVMKAYIAVREECEQIIRNSGLNASILRPWYVLGPGHRWPYALLPMYWNHGTHSLNPRKCPASGVGDAPTNAQYAGVGGGKSKPGNTDS